MTRPTSPTVGGGIACHTAPVGEQGYLVGEPPRAFAHRGWHAGELAGRENTRAAFARAVAEGYRYLETDVHATRDGVLIAFHDPRLDRVTDRMGRVADLPWSEVRHAKINGTEPIPLMADLLDEFPDARFNIDAKAAGAVRPLIDLITTGGVADRVCLGSFSDRRLTALRRALGPSVATSLGPREVFRLVRAAAMRRRFRTRAVAAQVPVTWGSSASSLPGSSTPRIAAAWRSTSGRSTTPAQMGQLLDLGVDGIMTDRPDELRGAADAARRLELTAVHRLGMLTATLAD